jgi:beta-phosphoglucomutase
MKTLLFDLDGVIIDSIDSHVKAFLRVFHELGIPATYDEVRTLFGTGAPQLVQQIFDRYGYRGDADEYAELKDVYFRGIIKDDLRTIPGALDFLAYAKKSHKIGICSATNKKNMDAIAAALGFDKLADVWLARQDVEKNKPAPDVYLKAAELLGSNAEECIVFEDSEPGIEAGKRAGMIVVALRTSHPDSELASADRIISGFEDIDIDKLRGELQ